MEKIIVSEDLSNYIEGLSYDLEGIKDLINRNTENGVVNKEAFEYWTEMFLTKNKEYTIAKNQVYKEFVVPVLEKEHLDPNKYSWSLDFATAEITLSEN